MLPEVKILPGFVKGVVYDNTKETPIEGSEITVLGTSAFFTTGSDGKFFINLPPGGYILRAEADGYETKEVKIKVTSGIAGEELTTREIKMHKIDQRPNKCSKM